MSSHLTDLQPTDLQPTDLYWAPNLFSSTFNPVLSTTLLQLISPCFDSNLPVRVHFIRWESLGYGELRGFSPAYGYSQPSESPGSDFRDLLNKELDHSNESKALERGCDDDNIIEWLDMRRKYIIRYPINIWLSISVWSKVDSDILPSWFNW